MSEKMYSADELVELTGFAKSTIYRFVSDGTIHGERKLNGGSRKNNPMYFSEETAEMLLERKGNSKRIKPVVEDSKKSDIPETTRRLNRCLHCIGCSRDPITSSKCCSFRRENGTAKEVTSISNDDCYIWSHASEEEFKQLPIYSKIDELNAKLSKIVEEIAQYKKTLKDNEKSNTTVKLSDVELLYKIYSGYNKE